MTKWEKIAAAQHLAWVEREKVRFYHYWWFVVLGAVCWSVVLLSVLPLVPGLPPPSPRRLYLILPLFSVGVVALALWVRKKREHLISENSVPHEGEGACIVRLPFVFMPDFSLVEIRGGTVTGRTGTVTWPPYCANCDTREEHYRQGGFEFSTFMVGRKTDTIAATTNVRRLNKGYEVTVFHQVPICKECAESYWGQTLVKVGFSKGFQFFIFQRPKYGARFRLGNPNACYACGYCGAQLQDDEQVCTCGKQQRTRENIPYEKTP